MSARRRGFAAERELARLLWSKGFAVIRGPASGARAKHLIYPDLVAIYKGKIYVIEVKYRHGNTVYIPENQVNRLQEFARRARAEALIAVKIPRKGWFIVRLEDAKKTNRGVKVDKEILARAQALENFILSVTNIPLETYTIDAENEQGQSGKFSSSRSDRE